MPVPASFAREKAFPAVDLPATRVPASFNKDAVLPMPMPLAGAPGNLPEVSAAVALPGTAMAAAAAAGDAGVLNKLRLLKRVQRGVMVARSVLHTAYMLACAVVSLWGLLLAGGAALAGHWALCFGQGAVSSATLYAVKKRKEGIERTISKAEDIVRSPMADLDVFEIVATVLKSFAEQGLDLAITAATAAIAPVALAVPTMILHFVPVRSWPVTIGVNAGVALLVAAATGVLYALYGHIKAMMLQKVDMVVDTIDDMPLFDFLDVDDDVDEKKPLLV